jgi:preprotein translocase subunit SecE
MVACRSPKPLMGVRISLPVPKKLKKMKKYIIESIDELKNKVTWPSWAELQSSTILVAISSVIIALIISVMDMGFDTILGEFYNIF